MRMRLSMARTFAFVLAIAQAGAAAPVAAPQAKPTPPATLERAGGGTRDITHYEAAYGTPEFRGLDDRESRPWPERQAIRTIGTLQEIPGRRKGAGSQASQGASIRATEWDSDYALYRICGDQICLAIVPVDEMKDAVATSVAAWAYQKVEVIGAIDRVRLPPPLDPTRTPKAFLVWSVFQATDKAAGKKETGESSLEPLVRYPKGAAGGVVTVRGTFRGANLFEDLAPESRRRATDWVLRDGPFSIWVTGKAPKGDGFSLDPQSRYDTVHRLEVTGTVESEGGYIYLRAKNVQLLGRAKAE